MIILFTFCVVIIVITVIFSIIIGFIVAIVIIMYANICISTMFIIDYNFKRFLSKKPETF